MNLLSYIKNIAKLSPESEESIISVFKKESLPKGHYLFKQNDICRHIFFIEKGLARTYYHTENGREVTAWFFPENSFITAIDSYYYNNPAKDFCELLEDSIVYSIKFSEMEMMLDKESQMAKFAFHVVYDMTKQMSEFIINLKFQTAEDRYSAFLINYPSILQRVSLGHIASYLGITQETLSRIRAGK